MSQSHFAKFPQINLPRSRINISFNHKLAMMHGYLTPIDVLPVVPGDSHVMKKVASLIHMSTPIVPFMDNIDMYVRFFFVPLRLLWRGSSVDENSFEKFMGANKGAGYQQTVPIFPACNYRKYNGTVNAASMRLNLSHLLGKPIQTMTSTLTKMPKALSVLKERGYYFIWNEYFRAEQLQNEYPVDFGDGTAYSNGNRHAKVLLTDSVSNDSSFNIWDHTLLKVNKKHDFFTSCTLAPQYGPSTLLPLGDTAPVMIANTGTAGSGINLAADYGINGDGLASSPANFFIGSDTAISGTTEQKVPLKAAFAASGIVKNIGNIVADLSQATAASINSLRFAFAVQRYLERSNYGSNHFYEILAVHYGVSSPDARLQRPEYLGGYHYRINVDQVLNATGKTDTDQTELGKKGAVSVTADRHFGFEKGFVEPGYIYILAYTKQDRTYSDMVLTEDIKTNKFEFYSPEFANIGDREVLRFELDGKHINDDVFGYQEAWAEYRFRPSRVSGDLNPSVTGSMPYWSLADSYSTVPQLGPTWIQEDRDAVARALVTGVNGPDFICDWWYEDKAARLMPVYSIPGLIDHVGSM